MSNTTKMARLTAPGALNDRTLTRLTRILIAVIAVGLPTIGVIYYLDRHVDAGPSIAGRAVIAAEEAVRQNPNQLSIRVGLAQAYTADNRIFEVDVSGGNPRELAHNPAGGWKARPSQYVISRDLTNT